MSTAPSRTAPAASAPTPAPPNPPRPMPAFSDLPLAGLTAAARTLYTNARDDSAIAAALADFGYTAEDFDAGLALTDQVDAAVSNQRAEYADQYAATAAAAQAAADLEARYSRHRQTARLAHPRGSDGHTALALAGSIPQDRAALVRDAATFYDTLAARPELATPIRGLDADAVADGQALVTAARDATTAQAAETGEAQRATATRDADAARLRAQAGELTAVAKLALTDAPQLREKLGLLQRS